VSSRPGSCLVIRIAILTTIALLLPAGPASAQLDWGRCPDPGVPGNPLGASRWYVEVSGADDDQSGGGNCTLRDAIAAVMTGLDGDGCTVASVGEPGIDSVRAVILPEGPYTYTLNGEELQWTLFVKGVARAALCGRSPAIDVVQASVSAYGGSSRVLSVFGSGFLSIYGVRIQNGNAQALTLSGGVLGADYGGGILVANPDAFVDIHESILAANLAGFNGGGLACLSQGRCYELDQVIVQQNVAGNSGGGVYGNGDIRSSIFRNNEAVAGGGLYTSVALPTVSSALEGGGPLSGMRNTEFYENVATAGGGWFNSGYGFVEGAVFEGNEAETAGGILISGPNPEALNNVTITYNLVEPPPLAPIQAGFGGTRAGGLLATNYAQVGLYNVTIASNEHREPSTKAPPVVEVAGVGAGLVAEATTSLTYTQSFIGGNIYTNGPSVPDDCFNDSGASLSAGYNRGGVGCDIDAGGDAAADPADLGSLWGLDARTSLDPAVDRRLPDGTFMEVRRLNEGSDAIDGGPPGGCVGQFLGPGILPVDARGYPRVDGDGNDSVVCDIGAYEFGSESPTLFSDGFEHLLDPCVWSSTVGAAKCGT